VVYPTPRNTINYFSLPYNPRLADRARELRKSGSLPETLLWKELKNKNLNGLDFDRQKIIGNYIVDFYCASNRFVIEIDDAATHDNKAESDKAREEYLKSLGLIVIRFSAKEVLKDTDAVIRHLVNHPGLRPPLHRRGSSPHLLDEPSSHSVQSGDGAGSPKKLTAGFHLVQSCDGAGSPPLEGCPTGGVVYPTPGGTQTVTNNSNIHDKHICDFVEYLRPGDVVVFNNSKVIPARFNASGYEITLHTAESETVWWGLCKKFNKLKIGAKLQMDNGTEIEVLAKDSKSGVKIKFHTTDVFGVLDRVGKMPLPPYITRGEESDDRDRYQTVYAGPTGSMAAPTAGLHFTDEMLEQISARGAKIVNITLHVGAGTWMPVKTDDLSRHKMHSEWGCITPKQADIINSARRVIAVGTTSLRLLESASSDAGVRPFCATTDIFITPGYRFRTADVLLTNFHLPKSTLFMLVSAFAGVPEMRAAYAHAIANRYRFFSYGDCCLLFKKEYINAV
jgi:S-adenosylmethionine:tRNA ribosyltransferase-isomerase